jgi:hypothetical protein
MVRPLEVFLSAQNPLCADQVVQVAEPAQSSCWCSCRDCLDCLRGKPLAANTPVAAFDFLNDDPGDLAQRFALNTDHRVSQFGDDLLLLFRVKDTLDEFYVDKWHVNLFPSNRSAPALSVVFVREPFPMRRHRLHVFEDRSRPGDTACDGELRLSCDRRRARALSDRIGINARVALECDNNGSHVCRTGENSPHRSA